MVEFVLRAHSVGCSVPQRIAGGRIHSVFQKACNLETSDGMLIGLLSPALPRTPWSLSLSSLPVRFVEIFAEGDTFFVSASPSNSNHPSTQYLFFPQRNVRVELCNAVVWMPRFPVPDHIPDLNDAVRFLDKLCDGCPRNGSSSPPVHTMPQSKAKEAAVLLHRKLLRATNDLAEAAQRSDCIAGAAAASALLGLGNGLTPTGDDILTGFLAGLLAVSRFDRGLKDFEASVRRSIVSFAPIRTSTISRTFLFHAVQGLFSENVVDLIQTVLNNEPCSCLAATAQRLCRFGASSGVDTLTGITTAWKVWTARRHASD